MKCVILNYSQKNVLIQPNNSYKKKLTDISENVMKRTRWKAYFYLRNEVEEDERGNGKHYGFNSSSCPHQIDELKPFENDMAKLIENVEFRRSHGNF